MTVSLFVAILTFGATLSSLLTEVIKKWYSNAKREYSANAIALIDAIVIGGLGTVVTYAFMGIPWTLTNIIAIFCMMFAVWMASMIGYDKVIQFINQLKDIKTEVKEENE